MATLYGVPPTAVKLPGLPAAYNASIEIDQIMKEGRFAEAEQRTRAELSTTFSPIDLRAELLQKHAYILNKLGSNAEAEAAANSGLDLPGLTDMRQAMLKYEIAISCAQREDRNRALNMIDEAIRHEKLTPQFQWELYVLKASLLTQLNRFQEAAVAAEFALIELKPNFPKARVKLGGMYANILNELGQYPLALQATLDALKIQAEIPVEFKADIYNEQARAFHRSGHLAQAIVSLQEGLTLLNTSTDNDFFAFLSINLCKFFLQSRQFNEIISTVDLALLRPAGVKPDSLGRLYNFKAIAHGCLEQDQQCLAVAEDGLSIPGIPNEIKVQLVCQKTSALNNLHRNEEAIQAIDVCLTIPDLTNESKAALFYPKAFALQILNRKEVAQKLIQEGVQLPSVTPATQQRLISLLRLD